jgi:beta-galactosidase
MIRKNLVKTILLATLLLIMQRGHAQLRDWENPQVFGINKLPGHATSISFPDEKSAMKVDVATSPRYVSLNGK